MAAKSFLAAGAAVLALLAGEARALPNPSLPLGDANWFQCWQSGTARACTAANVAAYLTGRTNSFAALQAFQGGLSLPSLGAHSVLVGEGGAGVSAYQLTTAQVLVGQGANADPAPVSITGDCALSYLGVLTCTKFNGVTFQSAAGYPVGTSGPDVPLLNGANVWGVGQQMPALILPPGAVPQTPASGQIWTTSSGVFVNINGTIYQLGGSAFGVSSFNGRPGAVSLQAADVGSALNLSSSTAGLLVASSGSGVPISSGFAIDVQAAGLVANDASKDAVNATLLQSLLDAHPTATFLFPPGAGCYSIKGPIYLSDSTGRNFSGKLEGEGGCITFTNAGTGTDAEISTQRGLVSYPRVNASGGDSTGIVRAKVVGLIMNCPAHGTCMHIANSKAVDFELNTFTGGRYGLVLESSIAAKVIANEFDDQSNAGLGLLMLNDTSRVWYGATPTSSYWNDNPDIRDNAFGNDGGNSDRPLAGALAFILDMGSQAEQIRTISGNVFYSAYHVVGSGPIAGVDDGTEYGYLSRNADPQFIGSNWSEGVAYPIRTLSTNAAEGITNLSGVTAAEPCAPAQVNSKGNCVGGSYALSNIPDGYGYAMKVHGFYFSLATDDINCSGIAGPCIIGGNVLANPSGFHVRANQGSNVVVDLGDQLISNYGTGGAYSSVTNGAVYNSLGKNPSLTGATLINPTFSGTYSGTLTGVTNSGNPYAYQFTNFNGSGGTSLGAFTVGGNAYYNFLGNYANFPLDLIVNNASVAQFTSTNTQLNAIPTSAGANGLYVCIDGAGQLYKKASCP